MPTDLVVDQGVLRRHPLPDPGAQTDKAARGTSVVLGGTTETPGAVLLAGLAALRAGAGKLQVLTVEPAATGLALAVPEARVIGLPTAGRDIAAGGLAPHAHVFEAAGAVLVGSGTMGADQSVALVAEVVGLLGPDTVLVLDAWALGALEAHRALLTPLAARVLAVPNPPEAARILDRPVGEVAADPAGAVAELVERTGVTVAVRHADTWTAAPGTARYVDRAGHPALGTSGSGDVLAGIACGLAARGADPLTAVLWAAHVHAVAGVQAAQRLGGVGILARELLDQVPGVLGALRLA